MKKIFAILWVLLPLISEAQYVGTASVSKGFATTVTSNIYSCAGGRIAGIGTIKSSDSLEWTVPAQVNYANSNFPFASNLHNACVGANYANTAAALSALTGTDIITIDSTGELITAFVFADNYFEMYINGIPVGKDNVPFTQFNSNIIRFRVNKPFTIAMLLVDWEENLGLGSENNGGFSYHPGDGGLVAVFKDESNKIIAKTDATWKAQTFYTSPISDLSCPSEVGSARLSNKCSTADTNNGSAYYALHWTRPINWADASFVDSSWPNASVFSNATIGVNNKPAYTNFTDIFDDPQNDAEFIWSSNIILDNEVIVRHTVQSASSIMERNSDLESVLLFPNPAKDFIKLNYVDETMAAEFKNLEIYQFSGRKIGEYNQTQEVIDISGIQSGIYLVKINFKEGFVMKKLLC